MANITGPKGPAEPKAKGTRPASDKPVEVETLEKTQENAPQRVHDKDPGGTVGGNVGDTFGDVPSIQGRPVRDLPTSQGDAGAGGSVRARLRAFGVKGAEGLVKTASSDAVRYATVPGGRILHGSVAIESVRSLAKLDGVLRITGDLSIQESTLKSADLLVLKSLTEVGGRLTLEGNAAIQLVDAFENLERARGIYFGFNPGITRVSLPKLKEIEAALIFEANTALGEIHLPAFTKGGLYVHVHDNQALTNVLMPSFASTKGELSFVDNPRLITVRLASKAKPATIGALELMKNGAASFPLLFANVVKT